MWSYKGNGINIGPPAHNSHKPKTINHEENFDNLNSGPPHLFCG